MPQIEVTFDIDANGILNVSAKDMATGKSQNVKIEASSGLNESEIEKMVNDAKTHEGEDKEKRKKIDIKNGADALVFQTEKNLKEYGDKIDADNKAKIEAAVNRVKEALKSENIPELESATEALNQVWQTAAAAMYQQTTAGASDNPNPGPDMGQGGPAESSSTPDDNTVDADFEVVNEK
jgi:molecular chaperone DnaK